MTPIDMVKPRSSSVNGKVWMQNNGFASIHRLDLATGQVETFDFFRDEKEGENHNIYDVKVLKPIFRADIPYRCSE